MQRVKLVVRMPCPHYVLPSVEVFLNLGPRALEMLRAPRYLNLALVLIRFCRYYVLLRNI